MSDIKWLINTKKQAEDGLVYKYPTFNYEKLIPALPGWFGVYLQGDRVCKTPVVAWARFDQEIDRVNLKDAFADGYDRVYPLTTDVIALVLDNGSDGSSAMTLSPMDMLCNDNEFLGYEYPGMQFVDWEVVKQNILQALKNIDKD